MNKFKLTYLALISVLSAGFANLHAQESEVFELEDYEVVGKYLQTDQINALKTPTPIEDVPQSLTILTSDLMELQDLTSISGIADYVPGISAGQGEGHRDHIVFRGVRSTADFFIDGVRDDVQYYRPLYNIDQVEVLKGANALFFGRGGTGGVINRVSKTAQIGEDFTEYSLSLDDLGERSLQVDTNMSVSPNAALRLNYYSEDLDNHREFYYGDNSGFNPTLKYALSDKTTINLSYENLDHERFIDRGIPSVGGVPLEDFIDITFGDEDENYSTVDADILKIVVDHKLNDDTKLRINYTDNDFSKVYQNFYASSYDPVAGTVGISGYRDTTQRASEILSADIIGEKVINGLTHKYVLGFEKIDTTNDNDRFYVDTNNVDDASKGDAITVDLTSPVFPSFNYTTEKYDETEADLEVSSIYFSDEIALTEDLDVILGGRIDNFELSVVDVYGSSGGNATKKDDEFSPRLGIVYKPKDALTYYASYSESFLPKSGDQYADLKGSTKQKTDPDVYENTEIGAKFDLDNGISVTAAYYDLNAVKPTGSVADGNYAVTETEVQGYELQAVGYLSDKWFISAGADFIKGEAPEEVAEESFSIWNLYQFDDKLSFGLGVIRKGETAGKGSSTTLPAYTRVDAAAYYKVNDNVRLQLNVENVTDELYYPYAYGTHQVSVGAPMHATLKIVGRF